MLLGNRWAQQIIWIADDVRSFCFQIYLKTYVTHGEWSTDKNMNRWSVCRYCVMLGTWISCTVILHTLPQMMVFFPVAIRRHNPVGVCAICEFLFFFYDTERPFCVHTAVHCIYTLCGIRQECPYSKKQILRFPPQFRAYPTETFDFSSPRTRV